MTTDEADLLTSILQRVVDAGDRQARGAGRPARLPARPARPTTTATRGSSATRPQLAVAVWVGYPDRAQADADRVRRQARRRRNAPGADLEVVHDRSATKQLKIEPEQFPVTPYIPAQEKRIVWREGSYKLDNGYCPGTRVVAYFAGRGPTTQAAVLRERGHRAARDRQDRRRRRTRRSASSRSAAS